MPHLVRYWLAFIDSLVKLRRSSEGGTRLGGPSGKDYYRKYKLQQFSTLVAIIIILVINFTLIPPSTGSHRYSDPLHSLQCITTAPVESRVNLNIIMPMGVVVKFVQVGFKP